jgi:MFS family permease
MTGVLRPVTETTIAAALVFGFTLALRGLLKLTLTRPAVADDRYGDRLTAVLDYSLIPGVLLGGLLLDDVGALFVLIAGSVMTAVGVFALGFRPGFRQAAAAAVTAGVGASFLGVGAVVLSPSAFSGADHPSASLNFGYVFIALGALIAPPLCELLVAGLGVRRGLGVVGLICLIPSLLAVLAGPTALQTAPVESSRPVDLLDGHSPVWLAALVCLLYAPLEAAIVVWAANSLCHFGRDERQSAGLLTSFWLFFVGSRLLTGLLQHTRYLPPESDRFVVVGAALLAAVVLGNLAGTARADSIRSGLLLLGFLLGPILPTFLGMVFSRLEHEQIGAVGTAFGVLFVAGSLGGLVYASVRRDPGGPQAVQVALRLPLALALMLALAALTFSIVSY